MMLTAEGFKRKTYEEYLAEMEQLAIQLFGADINLSENGPMGKFIRLLAYARAEEAELAEQVYYSSFVDYAEGVTLDYVAKNVGLTRLQAEKSITSVVFTVDPGTTVEAGVIVSTQGGIEFITTETVTDDDNDGIVIAPVEAVEAGSQGNVPANTITVINTPIPGVYSVTNPTAAEKGRDKETDKEFRDRYDEIGANSLSSTTAGIKTTILTEVPGAISAVVIENDNDTTDTNGRPPHSFEVIVYGGDAEDIAKAILKAKPAGIATHGSQTVIVQDDSGIDRTIKFSYAQAVQIFVNVAIKTDASYPANGDNLVKLELVKYIGGVDDQGNKYAGLSMGESVINARAVYSIIKNVPGVVDAVVTFSTDGTNFSGGNVTISPTQVANTDFAKVAITHA